VKRGRAVAVVALALALAVVTAACERGLPPTLVVEDVVSDLARDGADPARAWTSLDPGDALRADGARDSLVMAPGATTTWRIAVPDAGALRFGVGVEGTGKRDDSRAGLRFTITIDGAPAFAREVNPATGRSDRVMVPPSKPVVRSQAARRFRVNRRVSSDRYKVG